MTILQIFRNFFDQKTSPQSCQNLSCTLKIPKRLKAQNQQSMKNLSQWPLSTKWKQLGWPTDKWKLLRIVFDYSSFKTNWKNDLVNVSHTVNCAQFLCMCAICMHACVPHTLKQWATPIPRQHRVWNCICRQCNILHWSLAATLRSTSTTVLSMMIVNAAIDNHCFRNRTDSLFNGTAYNAWHHGKQSFSTWQPQSSQLNTLV